MLNQYQIVTDRIVAMLESGVRPWCKPWTAGQPRVTGAMQRPLRVTGEAYTGINVVNLWCAAQARGFVSNRWLTFNSAKELGASVRKGAKAELAFYAGRHTVADEKNGEESERTISFLRAYHVFNCDEIDNLPERFQPVAPVSPEAPIAVPEPALPPHLIAAQRFVDGTGAMIAYGGEQAFYMPSSDSIRVPLRAQFSTANHYFSTMLHELAHWTAAPARCARDLRGRFGDESYAAEELVAELASAFLCADLAIDAEPREDHAAYIASWIRVLKNDSRAIFKAATLAESASKYLHACQTAPVPAAPVPAAPVPAAPVPAAPVPAEPVPAAPVPAARAASGKRFRDAADFLPALAIARANATRAHGDRWDLVAGAKVWSRVPAAWARMAVFGRIARAPRDMALPAAQFWPDATLPAGPTYAADPAPARMAYPVEPTPAELALWARAHGLVSHEDAYMHQSEKRVLLAQQEQIAADKTRVAA